MTTGSGGPQNMAAHHAAHMMRVEAIMGITNQEPEIPNNWSRQRA